MNLAFHHFRKDLRQFRVFLALWLGLLLLDLAVNLGWVGQVEYSPIYGFDRASNTWTTILPGVVWALVGLLPSLVVLTDSPARREGFLATRPLPKRALFLAKMFFVLALIVAPWALQEFIHLTLQGLPGWVIERGTLERLLWALPVAVGGGAFAALWPSHARWVRAIGLTLAGYVLFAAVISLCVYFFHLSGVWAEPGKVSALVSVYALMLALVAFAIWHTRAHRGVLCRWGGLILVAVLSQWLASFWPGKAFKLQPENQSLAEKVMADSSFEIPLRNLSLQKEIRSDGGTGQKFQVNLTPKTKALPAGQAVEWSGKNPRISQAAGGELRGDGKIYHSELFTGNLRNNAYNLADYAAWRSEFPEDVLFHCGAYYVPNLASAINLGRFNLSVSRAEMSEPLTLQASLEARVFQWRKIADLPLTPRATAADEFGSWKFVATKQDVPTMAALYVERRQIHLSTATDSRCSSSASGPLSRMAFLVYDPVRHFVWVPDQYGINDNERAAHTALTRHFLTLSFYNQQRQGMFTAAEAARCRLIVFEKSWLGSVPEPWQSAPFTLAEKLQSYPGLIGGNGEPLPQAEFNRRIAALPVPAPAAPRQEVSLYLLEFLRLVEARHYPLPSADPLTAQLARFVPAHLELLLNGLPAMTGAEQTTVINAIKLGATEEQKSVIIAAFPQCPGLADVLLARDWVEAARPEIYQLVKSERWLPVDAMRAVAWFHDPQTYPRLLEEFEANPSVPVDELLSTLPGLAPELDAIVARKWREEKLVLRRPGGQMFGEIFKLAMRHGDVSALQRFYQVLDDPNFNRLNNAMNLGIPLAETIPMPGLKPEDRYNYQVGFAWMRQHRPEDFVFSPARKQFVLKSNLSARETVSAQNP